MRLSDAAELNLEIDKQLGIVQDQAISAKTNVECIEWIISAQCKRQAPGIGQQSPRHVRGQEQEQVGPEEHPDPPVQPRALR